MGRYAECVMENLLVSMLGSQRQLPWTLTNSLHYLSFWNGKPRVCLILGLPNSGFSLNPLSGIPPRYIELASSYRPHSKISVTLLTLIQFFTCVSSYVYTDNHFEKRVCYIPDIDMVSLLCVSSCV